MSKALIKEALDLCNDEEEFSGKKSSNKNMIIIYSIHIYLKLLFLKR